MGGEKVHPTAIVAVYWSEHIHTHAARALKSHALSVTAFRSFVTYCIYHAEKKL